LKIDIFRYHQKSINDQTLDEKMVKKLSKDMKIVSENNLKHENHEEFEETPTWAAVVTVLGYAILSALGWLRDFLRNIGLEQKKTAQDPNPKVCLFDNKIRIFLFINKGFCSTLSKL
jgi:hypothetical protein